MKKFNLASLLIIILTISQSVFADFKISQITTMEGNSTEMTIWAKGVRKRTEMKMVNDDSEMAVMMASMAQMPTIITQCDLKQDVNLNRKEKLFFIDYYDWSGLSPEQMKRRPNQKVTVKGTMTISQKVTDSGKRQQMFGLTARWMKSVVSIQTSADSCDGKSDEQMEQEGWFVDIMLNSDNCQVPKPPESKGGCRPRVIYNTIQNSGFLVEGTTKSYENGKLTATGSVKTTALTKEAQNQSLFEIPKEYTEVDSFSELMKPKMGMQDIFAQTQISDNEDVPVKGKNLKTVAIDFFSGNSSNVNQDELRGYISSKLTAAGMSGFPINSQSDISTGKFVNVIGVELKKVKESGASKIGGLFGKVTGSDEAAKIGSSEAEITITIYGKDGKTVVASANSKQKVSGKANDAVKAAIDEIIGGLLEKIK